MNGDGSVAHHYFPQQYETLYPRRHFSLADVCWFACVFATLFVAVLFVGMWCNDYNKIDRLSVGLALLAAALLLCVKAVVWWLLSEGYTAVHRIFCYPCLHVKRRRWQRYLDNREERNRAHFKEAMREMLLEQEQRLREQQLAGALQPARDEEEPRVS